MCLFHTGNPYRKGEAMMIVYRPLTTKEIKTDLFAHFYRRQKVTKCWRNIDGVWQIKECPFIDDWTLADYQELTRCLQHTLETDGYVLGAFFNQQLKGFISVESCFFGKNHDYLDLSSLHVSNDMRQQGIGKVLFHAAKNWAKEHGAKKLYISSHSAVETQSFYQAMGCVDAIEINERHVISEPFDRQLECLL